MITSNVTLQPNKTHPTFPLLAKSVVSGNIVLFTSEKAGTVIVVGDSTDKVGYNYTDWVQCFNPKSWTILPQGSKVELIQD